MYRLRVTAKSLNEMNRVMEVLLNPSNVDKSAIINEQDEKRGNVFSIY